VRAALGDHRSLGAAGLLLMALVWEGCSRSGVVNQAVVPPPSATIGDLADLLTLPGFWVTFGYTLRSTALGLLIAMAVALPLGIALAGSAWLRRFLGATIDAVRPIPPVVVLPLALLVMGGGVGFKLALVLQGALWPLLLQTIYGVRSIDPVVLDVARSFQVDPLRKLFLVRIPAAAPVVLGGVQLSASIAFGVSVMSELIGGGRGLGSILAIAQSGDNVQRVYAITIFTGLVGLLIAWSTGRLRRLLAPWDEEAAR
jgi:ABC-type nitrate/sulfonate/bicarbonate transport system permease component